MKANELNTKDLIVEDWVEVISNDHLKYVQIAEIYQNSILTKESEFESEEISIDNIKPIPLTPEILEKNGFYHKTNVGYIDDDYNGRQIIYDFWNHNLKIIYNYKTMLDIEGWLDHIHVHELQHALKLCGIEKTIEL